MSSVRFWFALVLVGCVPRPAALPAPPPPVPPAAASSWVDPLIGTGDGDSPDPPPGDKGGATFPGAVVPFGMLQWSPDTEGAEFGYHHDGKAIRGFSLDHISGAGCAALLDFPFLPIAVPLAGSPARDRTPYLGAFSHAHERAVPGRYEVTFDSGMAARFTVTTRAGLAEVRFPPNHPAALLIDAGKSVDSESSTRAVTAQIEATGDRRVVGTLESDGFCGYSKLGPRGYRVHFVAVFDQPFVATSTWDAAALHPGGRSAKGPKGGIALTFPSGAVVKVKVALSFVSVEGAAANLAAELPGWDFDATARAARERWDALLGRVRVEGGSAAERRTFTTALYHALLHPNVFSDADGRYVGFDKQVHVANGYTHHANVSGWDIYRSWIQLAAIVAPDVARDVVRSLVTNAQQCGGLPRWTLANEETGVMVGDPSSLIIANAHAFGVRGFDERAALALMVRSGSDPTATCNGRLVRPRLAEYLDRGYLALGGSEWGPPSITLEYAAADAAIARFAEALGDRGTAARFAKQAGSWRTLFDRSTGYVRPRAADGAWLTPFKPEDSWAFVEGNAAQYTFFVPHDLPALFEAMGGRSRAIERLDHLFSRLNAGVGQPYFYIGNEPQFGTPWAYSFAGAPVRTQEVVRRIVNRTFADGPGGLPGNDDLGATSSWYVFAALGLYPAVPGAGDLVLASPLFPAVTIDRPGAAPLRIEAAGAAADRPFVRRVTVDGQPVEGPTLPWSRIARGATIRFELADVAPVNGPSRPSLPARGRAAGTQPPSN